MLHEAVPDTDSLYLLRDRGGSWADEVRSHRAIGVVYDPRSERRGNYVPTVLSRRYDAFVHCDDTTALYPLHKFERETVPAEAETFPTGQ